MRFGYLVIMAVGLEIILGRSDKRKLCVEYRVSNGHRNENFLGVSHYKSASRCLQQCCRFPLCSAYNYLQNGTCQLLPRTGNCNAPEKLEGSSYVNLRDCRGDIVWQVNRPDIKTSKQCIIWHRPLGGSVICFSEILRAPDNKYCAGVGANKGLYLPGWYENGKFRVVSEQSTKLICKAGYFLQVTPNCSSMWQDYTVGDPIPGQAVQISVWKDGTPLYMVAVRIGFWYVGYYLPSAKRTFVLVRQVESPTNVKMLIMK